MQNNHPLVGFTVDYYKSLSHPVIIDALKLIGVRFVEISRSVFSEIDKLDSSLKNVTTAFHLPLVHDDGWDFSYPDHQQEIDEIIQVINTQRNKLHIHHAIAHPPEKADTHLHSKSSLDCLFQNLARLQVPVYLENVPDFTPSEYEKIFETGKRMMGDKLQGMCWDASHFHIKGYDPIKQFEHFRKHIGTIHLSDCYPDNDVHLPFDSGGSLPIDDILEMLSDCKFKGYITLEIKPQSLQQIDAYISSYLKILRTLHYKKYLATKFRLLFLKPLINRFLDVK
ncbi:MAG: TIM barrel protein [Actinobacteria bacterium]|nr:TIM barrel protein [Actinomycetota bacterium]